MYCTVQDRCAYFVWPGSKLRNARIIIETIISSRKEKIHENPYILVKSEEKRSICLKVIKRGAQTFN